jgi:hypothetical protein
VKSVRVMAGVKGTERGWYLVAGAGGKEKEEEGEVRSLGTWGGECGARYTHTHTYIHIHTQHWNLFKAAKLNTSRTFGEPCFPEQSQDEKLQVPLSSSPESIERLHSSSSAPTFKFKSISRTISWCLRVHEVSRRKRHMSLPVSTTVLRGLPLPSENCT